MTDSQVLNLLKDRGLTPHTIGREKLARLIGATPDSAKRTLRRLRRPSDNGTLAEWEVPWLSKCGKSGNITPLGAADETVDITENKAVYTLPKTRIHTLEALVEYFKVDLETWEVERFVCNKWEVGAKDKAGEIQISPLFQVKAWFRKRKPTVVDFARQEIEALKEAAKLVIPKRPNIIRDQRLREPNLLELSIPDLHYNKLAWSGETGWGNWDSKIADATFNRAVDYLIDATRHYDLAKILLVIGNDMLHANGPDDTTAHGTPQDVDSRYHKSFRKVREMVTNAIERIRTIAPVDVLSKPGNHDLTASFHLGDSLECLYHDSADVKIINDPTWRTYYQWGDVMLCFAHGDKIKRDKFPGIIASERREMFGKSKFVEIHTGHFHRTLVETYNGVVVRILPSLCQPDSWHSENGFVGNLRQAEAFVWNANHGLLGTAIYTDKD